MNIRLTTRAARAAMVAAAVATLAAACGSGSSGGSAGSQVATQSTSGSSAGTSAVTLTTHKGPLGTYLTDGQGMALYLFAADSGGKSSCSGSCAKYWPPLTGSSAQTSGSANSADTGTVQRSDGAAQITYAGHPLYRYVGDAKAGDTKGQGLNLEGGLWWLVGPDGKALSKPAPAKSSSGSSGAGWS